MRMPFHSPTSVRDESGVVLVEIVVSAMLLIIVALGVFTAFDVGTRASAEERHRARAHALAEADVARMQSMRIAELATLNQTRTVRQDGLDYTIRSRAEFATETATTSTCAAGTGSRDYIRISSTITWPTIGSRPPVSISSIVSPPNGSVVPNSGSLLVSMENASGAALPGVTLSGSGPGSFTGTTSYEGCVMWRNLPAGNYTMSISGTAAGKVDVDGNEPAARTVSVVAQSSNTISLQYDAPGLISGVAFKTRGYIGMVPVPSTADSIVVDHTGMTTARVFAAPGGVRAPAITTPKTLFPFTSPYSVYAGSCGANNPGPGAALGSLTVPPDGSVSLPGVGHIELPALHLTVLNNTSIVDSLPVAGGEVKILDTACNVLRTATTDALGRLPDPGLPWSTYKVCVSGIASNGQLRHRTTGEAGSPPDPVVKNLQSATSLVMFLRGTGSQTGPCP